MSEYRRDALRVGDRLVYRVIRKAVAFVGVGATVVWSGITRESSRLALREFREREAWYSRRWPNA